MGLLQRSTHTVTIYPEVTSTDEDGNLLTKPSATGVPAKARIAPKEIGNEEDQSAGFNSEIRYRIHFQDYPQELGTQSQVEWDGKRYAIEGPARVFGSSPKTSHTDYVMVRR